MLSRIYILYIFCSERCVDDVYEHKKFHTPRIKEYPGYIYIHTHIIISDIYIYIHIYMVSKGTTKQVQTQKGGEAKDRNRKWASADPLFFIGSESRVQHGSREAGARAVRRCELDSGLTVLVCFVPSWRKVSRRCRSSSRTPSSPWWRFCAAKRQRESPTRTT